MESESSMMKRILWYGEPTEQIKVDAADFWLPVVIVFGGNFLFFFWC